MRWPSKAPGASLGAFRAECRVSIRRCQRFALRTLSGGAVIRFCALCGLRRVIRRPLMAQVDAGWRNLRHLA